MRCHRAILLALLMPGAAVAQRADVTLRAGVVLDGRGGQQRDVLITIRDGRIFSVTPFREPIAPTHDLSRYTVLPGLIDAHVHATAYLTRQGRAHSAGDGESRADEIAGAAANQIATLRAGFTTVQSMGASADGELRDAIAQDRLTGPRLLTSLTPISNASLPPDTLRQRVRALRAAGADFVKIFASRSIREGGARTMSDAQLSALCDEARSLGLRSVVHAHSAESMRATVLAGCDWVEHGAFATDEVLRLMADRRVFFDPQCSLVLRNYLDNRQRFEGVGNFNPEGFAAMERAVPLLLEATRKAIATPNLRLVYGTDAVAGAHGNNADDLVCRVREAGQSPMDAIVTATSRNAEAMGLGDRIGAVAPGFDADLIAVEGNPALEIEAIRRVVFVMKGGRITVP
jgi:imidazolonepropionase-like amidohydrolase